MYLDVMFKNTESSLLLNNALLPHYVLSFCCLILV